jgi:outer membrane protein insertion porin family
MAAPEIFILAGVIGLHESPSSSLIQGRQSNGIAAARITSPKLRKNNLNEHMNCVPDSLSGILRPGYTTPSMPQDMIRRIRQAIRATMLAVAFCIALPTLVRGQASQPATAPASTQGQPTRIITPAAGQNVPDGLRVLSVQVIGNTRTDTSLILNQVRTQVGQPYSSPLVASDTNSIAALDRFLTVEAGFERVPDPQTGNVRGVNVYFKVEERALVTAVQIAGNRKIKESDIRGGLAVHSGAAIDASTIQQDKNFILDQYRKKGYDQVSVDVDQQLLDKEGIVRYQIIEGPQTKITKIEFEGNHALSDSYIKWRIQTKTYIWIFRKGTLDEDKLKADVAAIIDMYHKKGYIDVRVSYTLEFSEDKSNVTVHFVVLEGVRYKIGKLIVNGNTVFSTSELLGDTTRFGPGSYAERDRIQAIQKRMQDMYGHEGYIYSDVEVKPAYTDTAGVVDINFNVTEKQPYTVGNIIVRGNGSIQDRVIRRQIRIYPDQTFDMVLVRKSIERLRATRLFPDVKLTPINSPGNPEGQRDALLEVQEGPTGKYSLGAGVSTNSGLVGQLSIEQSNFDITNWPHNFDELVRGQSFKGAGQYFQLLLEPGTQFQRYRLTFQEPYLFDTPYSFSNDLYYFTRARESWDETRIGDLVTFGHRFSDVWAISLAFRAEQVTISNAMDVLNNDITESHYPVVGPNGGITFFNDTAQEILNEKGSHFLTSIKPAIIRDTTDSATFPTTGTRTVLSIEQYGVMGGQVTMTKIVFDFNWYYTVYTDIFDRKTVLALRNEVGMIPFGTSPTYERFYGGGLGEERGFKFRGISPRSGPLQDPIGGDFSWTTTAELNFPVYEEFLRGVVFVDVGTVEKDITIGTVRSDIGVGVRFSIPITNPPIPISLDFAYPLTKQAGDETQFISIFLGGFYQ